MTGTGGSPVPGGQRPERTPGPDTHSGRPGPDADQMLAALYEAHYGSLARIAALLVGDGRSAEEIVQEAFAFVYRAGHLRDEEKALDYLRRTVVRRARAQAAARSGPPGTLLPATLRGLPVRQREALILKYYADWPDRQIAAAMGISGRALYSHIRRGLASLAARPLPD